MSEADRQECPQEVITVKELSASFWCPFFSAEESAASFIKENQTFWFCLCLSSDTEKLTFVSHFRLGDLLFEHIQTYSML